MNVARIRPEVVAHTVCPNGHEDVMEAINPVFVAGELVDCLWSSAFEFCMVCDEAVVDQRIEVRR